jgi:hypothetical protein
VELVQLEIFPELYWSRKARTMAVGINVEQDQVVWKLLKEQNPLVKGVKGEDGIILPFVRSLRPR